MSSYNVIYILKPVKEVEPGWWKLKWRLIWRETFSIYTHSCGFSFGFKTWPGGAHNGWNRSYDRLDIQIFLIYWQINFWIRWNFIVHKDGPLDSLERKPLKLMGWE